MYCSIQFALQVLKQLIVSWTLNGPSKLTSLQQSLYHIWEVELLLLTFAKGIVNFTNFNCISVHDK